VGRRRRKREEEKPRNWWAQRPRIQSSTLSVFSAVCARGKTCGRTANPFWMDTTGRIKAQPFHVKKTGKLAFPDRPGRRWRHSIRSREASGHRGAAPAVGHKCVRYNANCSLQTEAGENIGSAACRALRWWSSADGLAVCCVLKVGGIAFRSADLYTTAARKMRHIGPHADLLPCARLSRLSLWSAVDASPTLDHAVAAGALRRRHCRRMCAAPQPRISLIRN